MPFSLLLTSYLANRYREAKEGKLLDYHHFVRTAWLKPHTPLYLLVVLPYNNRKSLIKKEAILQPDSYQDWSRKKVSV